jgi:hypothetical protein
LTFMGGPPLVELIALYGNAEPSPPFTNYTTDPIRRSPCVEAEV